MSVETLLQTTLVQLNSHQATSLQQSRKTLQNVFSLLERLTNQRNIALLVNTLIESHIWSNEDVQSLAYSLTDIASRQLSSNRAVHLHSVVVRCLKELRLSNTAEWRKTIFLAAMLAAEVTTGEGMTWPAPWYSGRGGYSKAFITSLDSVVMQDSMSLNTKAGLLIAMSWVVPALSDYQLTKISDNSKVLAIEALYTSRITFPDKNDLDPDLDKIEQKRGYKELGLLTRTIVRLLDTSMHTASITSSLLLLENFTSIFAVSSSQHANFREQVLRTSFLSTITVLEALLANSLRYSQHSPDHPVITLRVLRNLQDVHPDPSVFESWRFCFNLSIDTLDSQDKLEDYVLSLLNESPASENPLITYPSSICFSKRQDDATVAWLTTVTEASASALTNPTTVRQLFQFNHDLLTRPSTPLSSDSMQLVHSVILSLFTCHFPVLRGWSRGYFSYVLALPSSNITTRQKSLIAMTLYRLSLPPEHLNPSSMDDDPMGLKASLFTHLSGLDVTDAAKHNEWEWAVSASIELVPLTPALHLTQSLESTASVIDLAPTSERQVKLWRQLVEMCSERLDSEKSAVAVEWLMRRAKDQDLQTQKGRNQVVFISKL